MQTRLHERNRLEKKGSEQLFLSSQKDWKGKAVTRTSSGRLPDNITE
jgi:hypothetical protein